MAATDCESDAFCLETLIISKILENYLEWLLDLNIYKYFSGFGTVDTTSYSKFAPSKRRGRWNHKNRSPNPGGGALYILGGFWPSFPIARTTYIAVT